MNKKRLYVKPTTTVADIEISETLLSASSDTLKISYDSDATGFEAESKGHSSSVWGFDDDEE